MDFFATFLTQITDVDILMIDIVIVIFGTFFLSSYIGWVYKKTYQGKRYTQGYVQTLIVMSVLIAMIMLIVGSNIARAFTMMGALSIIRFRNNLKDTRDIGFIFFAMAVGMAMGVELYLLAFLGTLFVSIIFFIMSRFNWFSQDVTIIQVLDIEIEDRADFPEIFSRVFEKYDTTGQLTSIEASEKGEDPESKIILKLTYTLTSKEPVKIPEFLNDIRQITGNHRVLLETKQ